MMKDPVKLIECPRDAWQGLKRQIPTALKVKYLRALVAAGFKHIDAVSFVSPKAVPQMVDSEEVLEQLAPPDDVEIIAIVVNEKGAERAIATGRVSTLGYPFSISETFLRKNQNQSPAENYEVLKSVKKHADGAGIGMVVYVSMAFGNPYGDLWSENEIKKGAARVAEAGIRSISLADTVGLASPELISRVMSAMINRIEDVEIGVHMHSAPNAATAKVLAAYDAGSRRFDSAMGGLGGCPFAQDALVGNIPTESVLAALQQRGMDLPIRNSIKQVMTMSAEIGSSFG